MRQFIDLLERLDFLGSMAHDVADADDLSFDILKKIPIDREWVPIGKDFEAESMLRLNTYMRIICEALGITDASIQKCIREHGGVCSLVSKKWVYCVGWDRTNWRSTCHVTDIGSGSVIPLDSLRGLVICICVARHRKKLGARLQAHWEMAAAGSDGPGDSNAAIVGKAVLDDMTIIKNLKTIPENSEWLPRNHEQEGSCIANLERYVKIIDDSIFHDISVSIHLTVKNTLVYFLIVFDEIGYYVGWGRNTLNFKCCMIDFKDGGNEIVDLESLRELVCILCVARGRQDLVIELHKHWRVPAVQSLNPSSTYSSGL